MPPIAAEMLVLLLCYFIGAIPTGLMIGLKVSGIDIREHGSKNIGTTNTWRVLGWKLGLTTFLIDVGKACLVVGYAVAMATGLRGAEAGVLPFFPVLAGLSVLLGNFFNIFLGFKGGKGVATSLGVFLALATIPMLISFAIFGLTLWLTKYVSVASLAASLSLTALVFYWEGGATALSLLVLSICILIIIKHKANIQRLMNGTENRIGQKKAA